MATLVFDIETAPRPWDAFDEVTKAYLTRAFPAAVSEEERSLRIQDVQKDFGLSPFTGMVVAIGVYDLERAQGAVYYQSDEEVEAWQEDDFMFHPSTEREMLQDFWDGAESYNVFVTFAGRMFDAPYVALRSAAHNLRPTKNLLEHRYLNRQSSCFHVDLQDQFSYYGAMGQKPSLHMSAQLFDIESSKAAGVSGADVAELFANKKFRDIARYNARDVRTTVELYKKWHDYLAPSSFKNIDL